MEVEKAFAIHATPAEIFAAIERELEGASEHEGRTFEVLRRDRPSRMDLRVTIGGTPCRLTYKLAQKPDHTEVSATLVPGGWKHALFRIITFGMQRQGYEVALVESLANLKAGVEDASAPDEGERYAISAEE